MSIKHTFLLGDITYSFETGEIAKQASGAVELRVRSDGQRPSDSDRSMQQAAMEAARRTRLEDESRKYLAAPARLDCGDGIAAGD